MQSPKLMIHKILVLSEMTTKYARVQFQKLSSEQCERSERRGVTF